jgi:NADPH-dependent curcumin reductase CurA
MSQLLSRQFRLAARPIGLPKTTDWSFTTTPVSDPAEGQLVVQVLYLSLDPAMRGWMNDAKSYVPPVGIGEVMRALGVGKVLVSKHPRFSAGDFVTGTFGIQDHALSDGKGVVKVDPAVAPLPTWISALGMTGLTAYFGLLDVGQLKTGDTVVISAAAGAVGSVAGQIARLKGCRAIGIAGGPEKCRLVVDELGFDGCIDYKAADLKKALKAQCPSGVDVYFDNVGGEILDTVLTQINRGARVVICGAISQYNSTTPVKGPANYLSLLVNRARMEGFIVFDFLPRYAEATRELATWYAAGKLKSREDIVAGLEKFPDALLKLFRGENTGKLILKVADS